MDAASIPRQKEIGPRRFPSIMYPKPIFRCDANLFLDNLIDHRSQGRNRSVLLRRIKAFGEYHAPTRWTCCVNASSDERRSGAFGKQSRQRRSGGQFSEKRRPNPVITSVLVGQNTDAAAGAQQFDHRIKSGLTIEQLRPSLAARPTYMLVNETVAKLLINARISHEADKLRHQLR